MEANSENANIKSISEETRNKREDLPRKTHDQLIGILRIMHDVPHYLSTSLYLNGWLFKNFNYAKYFTKFSRILIGSLFKCCLSPNEDIKFLLFMKELLHVQLLVNQLEYNDKNNDYNDNNGKEVINNNKIGGIIDNIIEMYIRITNISDHIRIILPTILMEIVQSEMTETNIERFINEYINIIINNIYSLPVGIRLICYFINEIGNEIQLSDKIINKYIKDIIFGNLWLKCLTATSLYTLILGVDLSTQSINNLSIIANKLTDLVYNNSNNIISNKIDNYINNLITIDPNSFLLSKCDDHNVLRSIFITKSELEMLIELLLQVGRSPNNNNNNNNNNNKKLNLSIKLWNENDELGMLLDQFVLEQRNNNGNNSNNNNNNNSGNKTKYHKIHPRMLISLTDYTVGNVLPKCETTVNDNVTKELRKKLYCLLSDINFIPCYNNITVIESLQSLLNSYWNKNYVSLVAQVSEIIKDLFDLPLHYKLNDFQIIIDQMKTENELRLKDNNLLLNYILVSWDFVQTYFQKAKNRKTLLLEYYTKIKVQHFIKDSFQLIKDKFIDEFTKKYKRISIINNSPSCDCNYINDFQCNLCESKNNMIKLFLKQTYDTIKNNSMWTNQDIEEIKLAYFQVERQIMGQLYEYTFPQLKEDIDLRREINMTEELQLDNFEIPIKFYTESPWPLARVELEKITLYKAPYDKFICISKTWEVISYYVSIIDLENGVDILWAICSFIIYQNRNIANLFSNLQYISNLAMLDELEEGRLLAFRNVLKVLQVILSQSKKKEGYWYWPTEKTVQTQPIIKFSNDTTTTTTTSPTTTTTSTKSKSSLFSTIAGTLSSSKQRKKSISTPQLQKS